MTDGGLCRAHRASEKFTLRAHRTLAVFDERSGVVNYQ